MTITLGRVGTDGISLGAPLTVGFQGERVTLSGRHSSTSSPEVLWLRDQILGLAANDSEPIVPFTCSERPELDGYYRVASASATHEEGGLGGSLAWLPWEVQLERLKDYRQPRIEVAGLRGLLTNSLGLSCDSVSAAPNSALDYDPGFNTGTQTISRTTDTGVLQGGVVPDNSTIGTTYTGTLSLVPSDYYIGACRAQMDISGTGTWRDVVARRATTNSEFNGNRFRLGNGLVRVTPGTTNLLSVSWYDGVTWSTPTAFDVYETGLGSHVVASAARVLRLGPEEIAVRLQGHLSNAVAAVTVDLLLRRGLRHVFLKPSYSSVLVWQLRFSPATASTSLTGGLQRTASNADGDREILISNTATTKDTVNGRLTLPSGATSALFGIGLELGGTGATGQDTASNQIQEWFSAQSETQRVVAG